MNMFYLPLGCSNGCTVLHSGHCIDILRWLNGEFYVLSCLSLLMFVYMCMCVHMCAIMCVNESSCEPQTWRSEDKLYLFERALCCSLLCAQLDDPLPPRILLAHFPLPPQGCWHCQYSHCSSRFYGGSGDSNSGLHVCMANASTIEPSPSSCTIPFFLIIHT